MRIGEDAHRNPLMQNEKRKNLTILIVGETSQGGELLPQRLPACN
ncbi:hypothetical protein ACULNC_13685 [Shigella flexneri]